MATENRASAVLLRSSIGSRRQSRQSSSSRSKGIEESGDPAGSPSKKPPDLGGFPSHIKPYRYISRSLRICSAVYVAALASKDFQPELRY